MAATPASTHRHTDLEEALAELARAQAQTEAELSRLSVEMREFKDEMREFKDKMDLTVSNSQKQMGELANKMGTLVEDIVAPGLPRLFCKVFGGEEAPLGGGVRNKRPHESDPKRTQEYDAIVYDSEVLLINETRSRLKPEDIPALVEVLREARSFLSEARTRKVVGSLASFYLDHSLAKAGERQGLLMIGLDTGLLRSLNSPGFIPKLF